MIRKKHHVGTHNIIHQNGITMHHHTPVPHHTTASLRPRNPRKPPAPGVATGNGGTKAGGSGERERDLRICGEGGSRGPWNLAWGEFERVLEKSIEVLKLVDGVLMIFQIVAGVGLLAGCLMSPDWPAEIKTDRTGFFVKSVPVGHDLLIEQVRWIGRGTPTNRMLLRPQSVMCTHFKVLEIGRAHV